MLSSGFSVPDDQHGSDPWMSRSNNDDYWIDVPSEQAAAHGDPEALCNCGSTGAIEGTTMQSKQWLLEARCSH
jgi:hypothetical protein